MTGMNENAVGQDVAWSELELARAWEPVDTDGAFQLQTRQALHLLRRAAFGGNTKSVQQLVAQGLELALETLFAPPDAEAFDAEAQALIRTSLVLGDTEQLADWWLYRMVNDPFAIREKATLFWHGHFCTSRDKVADARLLLSQNELLRQHALGEFPALVKAISRDPAMLIYLDSTENQKARPNENYARELLELFCLGLGNYSERDIKELARCFTGWEVRRQRFRFSASAHDKGEKKLFDQMTSGGGDEAIDIILQQPAAARFVAERLIRFYCTHDPLPQEVINDLAQIIVANQWRLEPTLRIIFRSNFFFSPRVLNRQFASPVSWTLSWLRMLERTVDFRQLRSALSAMGQVPLEPPNVKGWPGGPQWIDPARMAARVQWVQRLSLRDGEIPNDLQLGQFSIASNRRSDGGESIVSWIEQYLLGRTLSPTRRLQLLNACSSQSTLQASFRAGLQVAGLLPEAHIF